MGFNYCLLDVYEKTKQEIGYVARKNATQSTYTDLGFKSGLEVHQQLKTKEKLFCRCPAGIYHDFSDYDAEIRRHMRPTLSELGEYDGTALMEFKTKKLILYRINNKTACTYESDDTPPFPLNREALEIATQISLLFEQNLVGELHITRKQYLDGSIPTGFQRTAIIGISGGLQLKNKKVPLIQMSIEEDSCREVSDIRHTRTYFADRLGTPLIETVTEPELLNPDEVAEAAHYIRYVARSTSRVRLGPGAGREDVNVSVTGGTRVEIKGVSHISWIPELVHNEAFRQKALLTIAEKLKAQGFNKDNWQPKIREITADKVNFDFNPLRTAKQMNFHLLAINLPGFKNLLSHFTQPAKCFANEISDRLKVIACLERPNMLHSEVHPGLVPPKFWKNIRHILAAKEEDAQIFVWTPTEDKETTIDVIKERCLMAFEGVPKETRKSFADGTTIFERVLPGADRMYPDTDSAPIPIDEEFITRIKRELPKNLSYRIKQLQEWNLPTENYNYILRNNLIPLIEQIEDKLGFAAADVAKTISKRVRYFEGVFGPFSKKDYEKVFEMYSKIKEYQLEAQVINHLLRSVFEFKETDLDLICTSLIQDGLDEISLFTKIDEFESQYQQRPRATNPEAKINWLLGQIRPYALAKWPLKDLKSRIAKAVQ
jgi:glutamyl-tRNA(Gln) amidotransferase subunit E